MDRKRVTCPETAHLEEIELEHTPQGIVIAGCSRFEPRCAVACTRECARRMDRRDHGDLDEDRVLVIDEDASDTGAISGALARELQHDGMRVEQANVELGAPPPQDYDAVVIGTRVRFGRLPRALVEYVSIHGAALSQMPAFLYVVGRLDIERFVRMTGWRPTRILDIRRRRWLASWFADPTQRVASRVHELAQLVADHTPAVGQE